MYYDERDNLNYLDNDYKEKNKLELEYENKEKNIYDIDNKTVNKYDYDSKEINKNNKEYLSFEANKTNNYENKYTNNEYKKWDNDIEIGNININNFRQSNVELYSDSEGFNKGNMFKNLYVPYKNYIYKVVVKGEKDELLLKIQELTFKVVDLSLYLDVNPNNTEIYNRFKNTVKELKKYKDMYERKYGPISVTETEYYNNYKWINDPWPWMNEGGKY